MNGITMPKIAANQENTTSSDIAGNSENYLVEEYLTELNAIHSSGAGVRETSYYPALANLFNGLGKALKPKVRCITQLKNLGAGYPDAGLFTADQFSGELKQGQLPSRGAIEAKSPTVELAAIALSQQVRDYLGRYGTVITTNFRSFAILTSKDDGSPKILESFSLAENEQDFWDRVVAHPRASAQARGGQFMEFIRRACLHNAPLANPRDVAWFLASYARDALARMEQQKHLPALQAIRLALEEALGMEFVGEKGEHFFRSTLVQTLFYGLFSAWVRWNRDNAAAGVEFDWRKAQWSLHVPFITALYGEVAKPNRLGALGLVEVLDWSAGVLNRVDRGEFFKRFADEQAVQYFYEPFLEAYDPALRRELGVWYTPREIVEYQVARVDTVLREELGLADGLADPNVIVLDPCCGTGAYLIAVLHRIARTLKEKGGDALTATDLKTAALSRVFGFEIMPAPFVVAHLQLGLLLENLGAPLSLSQRAGVYLTNALTGWEPAKIAKQQVMSWTELQVERDAAEHVKRKEKILVVLGNPPYNAFAGVSPHEEQGLVEPYKRDLNKPVSAGGWGIKKFNLDDLYVRFFRIAERRIAEMSGVGVVSFISNFSYLGDPSFVVMRRRLLAEFDKLWIDCMNGDSRETGKLTPDGKPDPSVFSTEYNREGIRVGTAVCVMVRQSKHGTQPVVRLRDFWGAGKRRNLLNSTRSKKLNASYIRADPRKENRFSFRPENVSDHYNQWPKLTDLSAIAPFNGPVERRGGALIAIDREKLEARLKAYFDTSKTDSEVRKLHASLLMTGNRIVGPLARQKLLKEHRFQRDIIVPYPFKIMDVRWAYLANIRPLFSEPSPQLLNQRFEGNTFFVSRDTADKSPEGPPFYFSKYISDYDCISGHARHFPVRLKNGHRLEKEAEDSLFAALGDKPGEDQPVANLSAAARSYLESLRLKAIDALPGAELIWLHALAIGYSPAYLRENADGLRRDWPRIVLPDSLAALKGSAALGKQVAALLDTEVDVPGVTADKLLPALKIIGSIARIGGSVLNPDANELAMTAGWGHFGKGNVVMPAKGKMAFRPYDPDESKGLAAHATIIDLPHNGTLALLGDSTLDVYLNDIAYWRNIPANVWNYHIGGYQVIKKWLSYRELEILGRPLQVQEVRELTNMARRIAALILLQPKLDANYHQIKSASCPDGFFDSAR
jgi:hypothetical protein